MKNAVIVVAAGKGTRAGAKQPKQYMPVGGAPVLEHTLRALLTCDLVDSVQCVIGPDDADAFIPIAERVDDMRVLAPVTGGATRAQSVANGLEALKTYKPQTVLIHDGARPFVDAQTIANVIDALATHDGAFASVEIVDALWRTGADMQSVDRSNLVRAQTPQGFRFAKIVDAFAHADPSATDDVAVACAAGLAVTPVQGNADNIKITTQADLEMADKKLTPRPMLRTGQGYDVHAFEPGSAVILCGHEIAHDKKLKGHSDADVAMHAITDALYGALGEGDIGQWFPPSDPQWKGAASEIFLKHAVTRVEANGYTVSNIDCTIICEEPKIGPHAQAMKEKLSVITGLRVECFSIKATTSERLGFTGRGEGIASLALATLVAA